MTITADYQTNHRLW